MKKFAIIGGGISGLAVLHYLEKRYADSAQITLYERNPAVGGTITTQDSQGFLFETGPNGFLNNQPNTFTFIEELGLSDQLIKGTPKARRDIQLNGRLHALPTDLPTFLTTSVLSWADKIALFQGAFKKDINTDQSVYDYACQRFSKGIAENLFDPLVKGVFAGDARRLHMASCFPRGFKPGKLFSLRQGMGQVINRLYERYTDHIQLNTSVENLDQIKADTIILSTPAFTAAKLLKMDILNQMIYAPVAVFGLGFPESAFKHKPDGFGYLIPSSQNKKVLGVLIESNVFAARAPQGHLMIRVMMKEPDEQTALQELDIIYGLKQKPVYSQLKFWPQAVPQYGLKYPALRQQIKDELKQKPNVHLCANYLDGISFNDCINNHFNIRV